MKTTYKLSTFTMLVTMSFFTGELFAQQTQKANTISFEAFEVRTTFDILHKRCFSAKTERLKRGKLQYSRRYNQVSDRNTTLSTSIAITAGRGSWFTDERKYLDGKIGFYNAIGDK